MNRLPLSVSPPSIASSACQPRHMPMPSPFGWLRRRFRSHHRSRKSFRVERGSGTVAFRNSWGDESTVSLWLVLVHSVWMDRYGVLGAWVFLWQTLAQLAIQVLGLRCGQALNLIFNFIYSVFYGSFLLTYCAMLSDERPRKTYIAGVGLYFLGYASFVAFYCPSLCDVQRTRIFLHAGTWLFLAGSVLLLYAVAAQSPKKHGPQVEHHVLWILCFSTRRTVEEIDKLTLWREPTWAEELGPRGDTGGSPFRSMLIAGEKYGGILAFLIGSLLFIFGAASSSSIHIQRSFTLGYVLFLLGRVLFLQSSQTELCDALFRTSWRCDVTSGKWRKTRAHWARGIGFYKRGATPAGGQLLE
eukprot:TRINITY_DN18111_c0_g1_i1.p1 TRINITY_DN18111_c0_g1~~TRINITY_DN18111_c0_g1_i1.p1  ORF type:complete len:366 (+),score=27.75 TRINITY_DN18111_c0_g1_i1:29-1099(+)